MSSKRTVSCGRIVLFAVIAIVVVILVAVGVFLNWRAERTRPTPTPTLPPPPPTPVSQEAVESGILYQTDFSAPDPLWELFDDGIISASITDGRLVVGVQSGGDTGAWSGLNYTFEDFVLDVDATKLAGSDDNGIMVIFRLVDNANYYRFDISSDGFYALSEIQGGAHTVVSDYAMSSAIVQGDATNHIRVEAVGGTFRFFVNDTPLPLCVATDHASRPLWDHSAAEPTCVGGVVTEEWQDADFPRGKIGLGAQGFAGIDTIAEATIGFDNLVITAPDNEP